MTVRLLRSALYVPATNARALEKAQGLPCDAIIFDLEDAVSPTRKEEARDCLAHALRTLDYGARFRIVRVNGSDDLGELADLPLDALLLPKVQSADLPDASHPLWVMMETAQSVLHAAAIAAHPRVQGLVMGTNDLMREMHLRERPDRLGLQYALGACVVAAKAAGKPILDGVHAALRDADGLRTEAEQGRDMGFDGKTVIHPTQLGIVNAAFTPDMDEIDLARRQIAAHEAAEAGGNAVAVVDGRIVESLHVDMARRTLALARAATEHI